MATKTRQEVKIDGKVYTLMGIESEEYLKSISNYIDNKIAQIKSTESGKYLSSSMCAILTAINVADDLYKTIEKQQDLMERCIKKEDELKQYETKLEKANKELSEKQKTIEMLQKQVIEAKKELEDFIEMFEEEKKK